MFCPVDQEECLDRLMPIGEQHFRRAIAEYVAHYDAERPDQGMRQHAPTAGFPITTQRPYPSSAATWWAAQLKAPPVFLDTD